MSRRCADCDAPMVSSYRWASMTAVERSSVVQHAVSGVCRRCTRLARRKTRPREVVVEEWNFLEHDMTISQTARVRQAADRLGMTPSALDGALRRAGIRP